MQRGSRQEERTAVEAVAAVLEGQRDVGVAREADGGAGLLVVVVVVDVGDALPKRKVGQEEEARLEAVRRRGVDDRKDGDRQQRSQA